MNKSVYLTVAAIGLSLSAAADEVPFSQLPDRVQTTINRNLDGGVVKQIDRQTADGRTLYEVEVRREGADSEFWVDSDGEIVPDTANARGGAGLFQKGDGKILGIPTGRDNNDFEAEARVGDNEVDVEADADITRDRGITEDVFDKNDGKLGNVLPAPSRNERSIEAEADLDDGEVEVKTDGLNDVDIDRDRKLNAEADIDLDDDNKEVEVTADVDEEKGIFRKGDGRILGIPIPGRTKDKDTADVTVEADVDRDGTVTADVDGRLDTDKNDGRILGVPKRGFEALPMSKVPQPVREAILREARGNRVAEVELATHDGQQVYEVDIEQDGLNRELHISPSGRILKDSDRDAVGSAPGSIRGEKVDRD